MIPKLFHVTLEIPIILIQQECGNSNFFLLVQGQVNSHSVLVQRKFYLSQKADMHIQFSLALHVLIPKVNFF